jgi:hypothetical protein
MSLVSDWDEAEILIRRCLSYVRLELGEFNMKARWSKTTWRAVSGIVASLILVLSFQNCGKAGFDADLDSSVDSSLSDAELVAKYGSTQAARVTSIPFSFDARFDQITYNSCAETQLNGNSAFFSLKAGAYRPAVGGVKLRQTFIDYINSNFYPVSPETTISQNQYKQYLSDSPTNANSVPVMAVRVKSSLNDVYSTTNAVVLNTDVIPMVGYLTDSGVMDSFVAGNAPSATFFPFSSQFKILEAKMNFNSSEGLARQYRDILTNSGALTLAYMVDSTTPYKPRSPASTTTLATAYGRGYQFQFSQPTGATVANIPSNTVYSIREYDLENPSTTVANWDCSRKYRIIRAQDAATYCPAHTITDLTNEAIRAEMEIVRRQYPADQWDFNVNYRCAVPKGSTSCYKEETYNGAAVGANYTLNTDCFQAYGTYTGTTPLPRCAQFISICLKP